MELVEILKTAVQAGASDIHLVVGKPPQMRLNGEIAAIPSLAPITPDECKRLVYSILYEDQRAKFEDEWELDSSFAVTNLARFRVNVLRQKGNIEAVMRVISSNIPTAEELRLPKAITDLADLPRGLVLVTGPTGSGKSTTLACIMEMINQKYSGHVLTVEDPIEFVYQSKKSIFRQRAVGELRDLETIQLAITAAETGHLCFGTLHTQDAPSTIDRIIDVFPPHQQTQIRVQLATTLQGVVAQILLPRKDGQGRVAAREIMVMTPAISNLIREGKTHMIYGAIDTGAKFGMVPMDRALAELVKAGVIAPEEALTRARNPDVLKQLAGLGGGVARPATAIG